MRVDLDRLLAFDKVFNVAPSPAPGLIAFSSNASGQVNTWLRMPDGRVRRVTPFTEERALPIAWSWDGSRLLIAMDRGGDEAWQLLLYDHREGWYEPLLVEDKVVHCPSAYAFSPDSKSIVYACNREEPSRFDVYTLDLGTRNERKLAEGPGGMLSAFYSPSGEVYVLEYRWFLDQTLHVVRDGRLVEITPHRDDSLIWLVGFYEGKPCIVTNMGSDRTYFAVVDAEKREVKKLYEERGCDVQSAAIGREYALIALIDEGYTRLVAYRLSDGKAYTLKHEAIILLGDEVRATPGRDVFYLIASTTKRPDEIYEVSLEEPEPALTRVHETFYGQVPGEALVEPESSWYTSFDGRRIHVVMWKPRNVEGEAPVAVWLHGGPWGQTRPNYGYLGAMFQYLALNGVAVVAPNFRGSTGYGREFMNLINRDWGGGELRDVEYLVKWLQEQPWADTARLAVFGGSYGGYLTLMCITRYPELWRAAVDWFGPSNLVSFVKSVPPYWRKYMKKVVWDPEDPEERKLLEERSPLSYVDRIKCPLLVIQGARDIRVTKKESDMIVEELRKRGVPVEYVVFEDEGHGFSKEENYKKAVKLTVDFLLKHLKSR